MHEAETPVEFMVGKFPTEAFIEDAITFLQQVSVSSGVKRKIFGEWARKVGAVPTQFDYERAARYTPPTPEGSAA